MQLFMGWCTPWEVVSGAENLVLQVLKFRKIGVCCKLPYRAGICHYRPIECFV